MAITCSSEPDKALLIDEMSEIEHFTTRFDGNPYFKWGFVPDAAMGDEIKVTILASGFGLFNEKLDQTDALSEDEHTKRAIRRERIYGSGKRQKRPHAFIIRLQLEDMINGDLPEVCLRETAHRRWRAKYAKRSKPDEEKRRNRLYRTSRKRRKRHLSSILINSNHHKHY